MILTALLSNAPDCIFHSTARQFYWSRRECSALMVNQCIQLFLAKKLPKTDPNAGGPGAGQQRPKGNVDLQERNQGGSGGCCK